jgi:hypothetical protein
LGVLVGCGVLVGVPTDVLVAVARRGSVWVGVLVGGVVCVGVLLLVGV